MSEDIYADTSETHLLEKSFFNLFHPGVIMHFSKAPDMLLVW